MGYLTEQHEAFRKEAREFVESEIRPMTLQYDLEHKFPTEVIQKMAKKGWLGIPFPKEYGGMGLDFIYYSILIEEIAKVNASVGVILSVHSSAATWPMFAFSNEEQKQKYVVPLIKGEKLGAFALTEEQAGSDASKTETTAVLDGDHYILNGHKIFITNGKAADTYIIFAMTDKSKGTKGISAFLVESGWEGFTIPNVYNKMGIHSSMTVELDFKDVKVPKENLLGEEGKGFIYAMQALDGGRIGIASQALGIAQGAFDAALEYSKTRLQFGQPIAVNQGISFMMADYATQLDAARGLIYRAAELKSAGKKHTKEAAMAKLFTTDLAQKLTGDAIQIFGGSGYMWGMDVERAYRDAKITQIYEGTNQVQRIVIAGQIYGKLGKKKDAKAEEKPVGITGERKNQIFKGSAKEAVAKLVEALKADGYTFGQSVDPEEPISKSDRIVSAGQGIEKQENMKLIEDLAAAVGAGVGSSRPVAEMHKFVPINRYVGISGQKFTGSLYIAAGISGAKQHLLGIKDAKTIVAINNDPKAPIFAAADYGIVGDVNEVLPLLTEAVKNA